jgi:hypothetical protein
MGRNSPLGSEGLPYAPPEYVMRGKRRGGHRKMEPLPTHQTYRPEIPLENEVVEVK